MGDEYPVPRTPYPVPRTPYPVTRNPEKQNKPEQTTHLIRLQYVAFHSGQTYL